MEKEYNYYVAVNGKMYKLIGDDIRYPGDTVVCSDNTIGTVTKQAFLRDDDVEFIKDIGGVIAGTVKGRVIWVK